MYLILKFGFYLLNSKDCVHVVHISEIVYSLTHVCRGVCIHMLYVSIIPPHFLDICMHVTLKCWQMLLMLLNS